MFIKTVIVINLVLLILGGIYLHYPNKFANRIIYFDKYEQIWNISDYEQRTYEFSDIKKMGLTMLMALGWYFGEKKGIWLIYSLGIILWLTGMILGIMGMIPYCVGIILVWGDLVWGLVVFWVLYILLIRGEEHEI